MATQCMGLRPESQVLVSKTLIVALMFSLTVATARVTGGLLAYSAKRSGGAVASSIITNLAAVVIYILGFLVILDSVGVQITPILTALGVGGLAVALALQDTLSNLFAGLQLVASKKINIGDYVRLENSDEGLVTDLTWRYTTICTLAGNLVIVPNAKLSSAIVTNYSLPNPEIPVPVSIAVVYGSDLERIERISIEVAQEIQSTVMGAVRDFQPVVRFTAFGESSMNFSLILRAASFEHQYVLRHEVIKRLHARFFAEGIDIPYPTRTLHLKSSLQVPT
jgi:small-conductance mechanosensitive channel